MSAVSPMGRSEQWLRERGYWVERVGDVPQRHALISRDLFGFLDLVALHPEGRTLGVQVTSDNNTADRARKMREAEAFPHVVAAGWRLVVHGWRAKPDRHGSLLKVDVVAEGHGSAGWPTQLELPWVDGVTP